MVVFTCDGCGEILKKSQVDRHAARCRKCDSVSCIDCAVSFFGDDYRSHNTCMTEVERYEKKAPSAKSAKLSPQDQWMELIRTSIDEAPGHLQNYLQTMADLDNVPRKEKQFRNFITNSLNLRRNADSIVGEIWAHLKALREKQVAEKQNSMAKEKEEREKAARAVAEAEQPKPKDKSSEKDKATDAGSGKKVEAKSVRKAMKKVLKKAENHSLSEKELRKAVLDYLGLSKGSKSDLKSLVKSSLTSSEKPIFAVNGKIVSLKVT